MSGNRNLKNRTAISTAIDNKIYARLKAYSKKSMIPISKLLDKAIENLLDELEQNEPDSWRYLR